MRETVLEAVLRSADAPSEVQRNRFAAFLKKQYGQEVPLRWEQDPALEKGYRMEVGADLYDWSLEGRLRQFRELGKVAQGRAQFPVGSAVLANDHRRQLGVGCGDLHRILQLFLINKHQAFPPNSQGHGSLSQV